MQIIKKKDSILRTRDDSTIINSYLFDEYEIHYNELPPHKKQGWHRHDKIEEVLFVIDGTLNISYLDEGNEQTSVLEAGDMVRFEKTMHTIENTTDKLSKFFVFKLILDGKKKTNIFLTDKINRNQQ